MDGFIFAGTNFRGLKKMTQSWGSKFVTIVFSFIIHTENYHLVGTGIRGSDPPRKTTKIGTQRNLTIHSICNQKYEYSY